MSEQKLSEMERKVYELLKQGLQGVDDIKSAIERQEGRPFNKRMLVVLISRLGKMDIGVRKEPGSGRCQRMRYTAAA